MQHLSPFPGLLFCLNSCGFGKFWGFPRQKPGGHQGRYMAPRLAPFAASLLAEGWTADTKLEVAYLALHLADGSRTQKATDPSRLDVEDSNQIPGRKTSRGRVNR
jgi:hypothetical protein